MRFAPEAYRRKLHGTFRIERRNDGYYAVDTDTFNPWSERGPFKNWVAAVDYAWEMHEFKTGHRQTLRPAPIAS